MKRIISTMTVGSSFGMYFSISLPDLILESKLNIFNQLSFQLNNKSRDNIMFLHRQLCIYFKTPANLNFYYRNENIH